MITYYKAFDVGSREWGMYELDSDQ
jgi:hypothetical protein